MKSRISIDIDFDNQPIIKIEYHESDDVRDKMVKRFMDSFDSESCWANFYFTSPIDLVNRIAVLRPIPSNNLEDQKEMLLQTIERVNKMQREVTP